MIANGMAARLLYRDAQGRSGEVALAREEPTYIGRALECAVRTDDAMVSRKHTLIRREGDGFVVEDLGSSNGTHVNDVRVERLALKHNDVVRCGNLWLRYVEDLDDGPPRSTDPGPGPGGPRPSPVPAVSQEVQARARRGTTPAPTMAQGSDSAPPVAPVAAVVPVVPPAPGGNAPDSVVGTVVSTGMPGEPPKRQARSTPTGMGAVAGPASPGTAGERLRQVHQRAAELERSLFALQRELNGIQQHLTDLLVSVNDLKDLTDAD